MNLVVEDKFLFAESARDGIIINSSWNLDIKIIQRRFDIWQGDADRDVPC